MPHQSIQDARNSHGRGRTLCGLRRASAASSRVRKILIVSVNSRSCIQRAARLPLGRVILPTPREPATTARLAAPTESAARKCLGFKYPVLLTNGNEA